MLQITSRASRPMYRYFALGENTRASTGRCVFKNRRCVCASTIGNFTCFGGTRRSSHGDISATFSAGSPPKIIAQMIFGGDPALNVAEMAPWLGLRGSPKQRKVAMVGAEEPCRVFKTQLPGGAPVVSARA